MPIHINEPGDGHFLTVHVSGILSQADYVQFVPEFERLAGQHRKLRVLFDMSGFHGWEAAAMWEEIKFDVKHLADHVIAERGVRYGRVVMIPTAPEKKGRRRGHEHGHSH